MFVEKLSLNIRLQFYIFHNMNVLSFTLSHIDYIITLLRIDYSQKIEIHVIKH